MELGVLWCFTVDALRLLVAGVLFLMALAIFLLAVLKPIDTEDEP